VIRNSITLSTLVLMTVLCSCSRLPDFTRMQDSMDRMAYSTAVMAANMPYMTQSTSRMAAVAERMDSKSDRMLSDLQSRGTSVERNVQLYAQSFLDSDKAIIQALKGIRQELAELKTSLKHGGGPTSRGSGQSHTTERLQSKLNRLEAQLAAISTQIAKRNEKQSAASR
jgi:hypothetical protein